MKCSRQVIITVSAIITGCTLPPALSADKPISGLSLKSESCLPEPKPLVKREPRYPRDAIRHGTSGWVLVEFDVSADGLPSNFHVLAANPTNTFDQAAIDSLQQWRFDSGSGREKCRAEFSFVVK